MRPSGRARLATILVTVAVAAGLVRAQEPPAGDRMSRDWKRLTTPTLSVVGNAREGDLRRVGVEIERFRRAVAGLSPSLSLESPVPTMVVVFRDDREFTPFKPRDRGKVRDTVAGYFTALPHVNYIAMAPTGRQEFTFRLVFHEYTHYLVNRNARRLPLWLNEGLAEFYSTFAGSERDGRSMLGRPIDGHVVTLLRRPLVPLAKFVRPEMMAELRRDQRGTQLFYAQSWLLTHFLIVGADRARVPQLARYLQAVDRGAPFDRAFHDNFGADLSDMDRELAAYVRQFRLPVMLLGPSKMETNAEIARMTEADAQQIQGDLLVHTGATDLAQRHLSNALALEPDHVPARLSLALLKLDEGDNAAALEAAGAPDFQESSHFLPHYVRAEALRSLERYTDAIAAYRRALSARTDAAYAYYGLSMAQLAAGDNGAAASFAMCLTQSPDPGWYLRRQREAMRLALDTFIVSDAMNYIAKAGWQGDEGTYVMLPAALALLRDDRKDHAAEALADIEAHVEPESFQAALVARFRGEIDDDALIAKAGKDSGLLTEARAYAGILASIAGDRERALELLTWVKTHGRRDFIEYGFALGELRRLEKTPADQPKALRR